MLAKLMSTDGIFYPIFALMMVVTAFVIIPRNSYKKFFLYGLLLGGVADALIVNTLTFAGLIRFTGMGPFGIFGLYSLWTPITWTFAYMIFYILAWTALDYSVGLVMENLALFHYYGIQNYLAPIMFAGWYSFSAAVFRKYEQTNRV